MSASSPLVILGTGLAGYTLAREWRQRDKDRPLVMLTGDDGSFYSKPMLSNALAQGKTAADLASKSVARMSSDLNADIRTGVRVGSIDPAAKTLNLDDSRIAYGDLALAVGAHPIRIPIAGNASEELVTVNSLQDYAAFRERLAPDSRVAIMGPGLIGCEFANDLTGAGIHAQVFGPDPWPLSTLLPEPAGRALQQALEEAGVRFHLETTASRIDRDDEGFQVSLNNGQSIQADLVLSAVGLRPDTSLAEAAGTEVGRGILADRHLRTSTPHIYALGDCAEVEGLNLPYVMPIMHAARALAKTLSGEPTSVSYPPMPVVIKTPALPTVVSPPPRDAEGSWETTGAGRDIRSLFVSADGQPLGFALTGEAAAEKQTLTKQLPAVL